MSCFCANKKKKEARQLSNWCKLPCFGDVKEFSNHVNLSPTILTVNHAYHPPPQATCADDVEIPLSRVHGLRTASQAPGPTNEAGRALSTEETERAQFGLKLLYDCDEAEADIVTVHGLNGHRETTFTTSNGVCWPKSLLPEAIPKIRVLSYGYDARTHSSSPLSREYLHDHAEQLLERLSRMRNRTKTTNRPIIFIAHNLGGIVVKSALILSAGFNTNHLETQKSISLSTYGILFMGTPHAGGGVTWGKLALNLASIAMNSRPEYLDILESNSQWLEQQQVHYNSISSNFDTKFFYETFETTLPGGGTLLIVPKHSACVSGAIDATSIAVSSDHWNMVKFHSSEEEGFLAISETVEIMLQAAAQKVEANWREWEEIKGIHEAQKISFSIPMNLPFARNRNFTGREKELLTIHEALGGGERTMVLYGLGGIGKTQLATQYAYSHQMDYTSVWWVAGNTTATLSQDFLNIAQALVLHHAKMRTGTGHKPDYAWIAAILGMPPSAIDEEGRLTAFKSTDIKPVIDALKSWFADQGNSRWLLVVDNYDDLENVHIADFLPTNSELSGKVIITSRAHGSRRLGKYLEIEEVLLEDGIEILRKSAGTEVGVFDRERDDANDIVQRLGALPLALDQAGAYISAAQIAYSQYLPRFDGAFVKMAAQRPPKSSWNYREETVFTTWEISFTALGQAARELLLLCGFLDNIDIWEGLLSPEILNIELGIESVQDAIQEIFSLSLAKRKASGDSFWIHSMVHRWSLERSDLATRRQHKALVAITLTSAALSFVDHREELHNLALEKRLLPHVRLCSRHVWCDGFLDTVSVRTDVNRISEVEALGAVLHYHWELDHVQKLARWVLAGREELHGNEHISTLATVHNMASVFASQGDHSEALEWYRRALTGKEKVLGHDNPSTLSTVHGIASVLNDQGKYDEALVWYRRALAGEEQVLGLDHSSTLSTVHGIASVYANQGKYDDALEWYERALAGEEKAGGGEVGGRDYPSTLTTVSNMASVFEDQGRYDDALEWYGRVYTGQEKALGESHPSTLATINNLASVLSSQGKYDDALDMYQVALAGQDHTLGKDHVSTLASVNNIASIFSIQGRYDDALEWYRRALVGQERALGNDHPSTLTTVHNMALVFSTQGKYDTSLEWYQRALVGKEASLGKNHPSTLKTHDDIAFLFTQQGKYDIALEWYQRALAEREKTLGTDHPSTFNTVHGIASVFSNQGKYDDALEWYRRALAGKEKALGKDHPSTLMSITHIAQVLGHQGKYDDAISWHERALAGQEKALGKAHPSTLATVNNMGFIFTRQAKYGRALEWYGRALTGQEKVLGKDHPATLTTVNNMGHVMDKEGKYDEAIEWYGRALAGQEKVLGRDHIDTLSTVSNMAFVFREQGKYDLAHQWYERALVGKEEVLGKGDHPSTLTTINGIGLVFSGQGNYDVALEWYSRALAGRERILGLEHPDTLKTVHNMASAFANHGKYNNAVECYRRALTGREKVLGKDHPNTIETETKLAALILQQQEDAIVTQ